MLASSNLPFFLQLLEKNCYLFLKQCTKRATSLQYGPLGVQLRENIFNEWKRNVLNSKEITVFPISSLVQNSSLSTVQRLEGFSEQYSTVLKMRNFTYPYGVASWTTVHNICEQNQIQETGNELLQNIWNPSEWTLLTTTYFCSSKESVYWFDRLHRLRLRWWRYLSQMPSSSFTFLDVSPVKPTDHAQIQISFNYAGQVLPLENIINIGPWNTFFHDDPMEDNFEVPSIIVCETSLDRSVLAFLLDAFQEKQRGTVLHLNHSIVPYKVTILCRDISDTEMKDAKHLLLYIALSLHKASITFFPNPHTDCSLKITQQFSLFDEMGIPYIIILESKTLSDGIVYVRNRDTTLEEQMHVADVTSMLRKYFKL